MENTQKNIQAQIKNLEDTIDDTIKSCPLGKGGHMTTEGAFLKCGKINFSRLIERFKHEDNKLARIVKDWTDYMKMLQGVIYEHELLDVSYSDEEINEHWDKRDEFYIKIEEINKRLKDLLSEEYQDPEKYIQYLERKEREQKNL